MGAQRTEEEVSILVKSPDGITKSINLIALLKQSSIPNMLSFGRDEDNDYVFNDRDKMISRIHFKLEYVNKRWWIKDEGSANGTFVRAVGSSVELDVRTEEIVPLKSGDEILILAKLTDKDQPIFWRMIFTDPSETIQSNRSAVIEYNLSSHQMYRVTSRSREEVTLSPQERALIKFMAERNQEANQSILCSYDSLIQAVWGDRFGHTNNEINRLIWSIRRKIEPDAGEPTFLKTIKGEGYLLCIRVI